MFLYGRSLFEVGKAQSNVLGGKSGSSDKKKKSGTSKMKTDKAEPAEEGSKSGLDTVTEGATELIVDQEESKNDPAQPLFTFTGDENFEDSEDENAEVTILSRNSTVSNSYDTFKMLQKTMLLLLFTARLKRTILIISAWGL